MTGNGVSLKRPEGWRVVESTSILLGMESDDGALRIEVTRAPTAFDVGTDEKCVAAGDALKAKAGLLFAQSSVEASTSRRMCLVAGATRDKKFAYVMYDEKPILLSCVGTIAADMTACGAASSSLQILP